MECKEFFKNKLNKNYSKIIGYTHKSSTFIYIRRYTHNCIKTKICFFFQNLIFFILSLIFNLYNSKEIRRRRRKKAKYTSAFIINNILELRIFVFMDKSLNNTKNKMEKIMKKLYIFKPTVFKFKLNYKTNKNNCLLTKKYFN